MRIAVGQLWQETNTFNRNPTSLSDFEKWGFAEGPAVIGDYGETGELGGFLEAMSDRRPGMLYTGLVRLACWPGGPLSATAWAQILELFTERLWQAGRVDAVFLALHGAMSAENEPDVTGALLATVRQIVGNSVPIVGTLDLHANITRQMTAAADVLVGYHTCPHLDAYETGQRAANALHVLLDNGSRHKTILHKLPMITPAEHHNTFDGPPAQLYETMREWEHHDEVLSAGLYMAMPWFDVPQLGWSVVATVTDSAANWRERMQSIANRCWHMRETMSEVDRHVPTDLIDRALAIDGHPVVIGDGADATNSGSPGDQTSLLRELLSRKNIPHGALTFLVDPNAVELASRVKVGNVFKSFIGADFAPEYGEPVEVQGKIERLVDLKFTLDGHIGKNFPIDMGRGAVLNCGDVTILLCERSGPGSTPLLYETAGLDPREFGIVIAKSPSGFRADYKSIAAGILLADGSGCASPHFDWLNFYAVSRPLWPLDKIESPAKAKWC